MRSRAHERSGKKGRSNGAPVSRAAREPGVIRAPATGAAPCLAEARGRWDLVRTAAAGRAARDPADWGLAQDPQGEVLWSSLSPFLSARSCPPHSASHAGRETVSPGIGQLYKDTTQDPHMPRLGPSLAARPRDVPRQGTGCGVRVQRARTRERSAGPAVVNGLPHVLVPAARTAPSCRRRSFVAGVDVPSLTMVPPCPEVRPVHYVAVPTQAAVVDEPPDRIVGESPPVRQRHRHRVCTEQGRPSQRAVDLNCVSPP